MKSENLRVRIARDVIAQINRNKYIATCGNYLEISDYSLCENMQLQEIIQKENTTCNVCAIGALFASQVNLNNEYTLEQFLSSSVDLYKINKIFGRRNNFLIEFVFEKGIRGSLWCDLLNKYDCYDKEGSVINGAHKFGYLRYKISYPRLKITTSELYRAIKFGQKYRKDEDRLIAIMKNIIRNNGVFVLPKRVR